MRILHCCLSCFYIDNYNYQENVLPRQNKADGHEVMILASTETFIDNYNLGYLKPSEYINEDGIKVIRVPYRSFLPQIIMRKIRAYKNVMKYMNDFKPDVILFHGASSYEIINVAKYKKKHDTVKLFVDSHEDFNNSARNFISKFFIHKMIYKRYLHKAISCIDKVLCISIESCDFIHDFYKIPSNKIEFYPLGGTIYLGKEYEVRRKAIRDQLKIPNTDILVVHSGKIDQNKRTTELIKAFSKVSSDKMHLIMIGNIQEKMVEEIHQLMEKDSRIQFLGWKSPEELISYLCAADIYVQPGSQSATLQNAICCGCPVMIFPHRSHEPYLKGNGFFVETIEDMANAFKKIINNPDILKDMQKNTYAIADDLLDYTKLAKKYI